MMRIIALISFLLFTFAVSAQKKFFKSIELLPFVYFDDAGYDPSGLHKWFKPPAKPISVRFDSLNTALERHGNINGGQGIQLRLQKLIPVFKPSSRTQIEWNLGAGIRNYNYESLTYTDYYSWDTVKPNLMETERLILKQKFADLYSAVSFRFASPARNGFSASLGFGLQGSLAIGKSRIKEIYHSDEIFWNGTTWQQGPGLDSTLWSPARKNKSFSWSIPFGMLFRLSPKIFLGTNFEYFHRRNYPRITNIYSEGMVFMLAVRYNP